MISKDSILNSIPLEMRRKDIFILEGIRYASNILDITFKNLEQTLLKTSNSEESHKTDFYTIFKEAWSFIDFSWKLRNILILLEMEEDKKNHEKNNSIDISFLEQTKDFRNTFQHLDDRINEVIVIENAYVWGTLSWLYMNEAPTVMSFSIAAGVPRGSANIINPIGERIKLPISHITLDSINRGKKKISINLSELYEKIKILIENFEMIITPQIEAMDNSKKHGQDLKVKIVMKMN